MCLTVLDVGQGDALLLELPGGVTWLVDGGGGGGEVGRYRLLPALRRRGIDRLDAVVATHGDADHAEGLLDVVEQLQVGELWVPERAGSPRLLRRLIRQAERRGVRVREAAAGETPAAAAPAELALLHPWPGWTAEPEGENDRSVVLRAALGRVSFLLAGDIEAAGEQRLTLAGRALRSTVLKVPHHGSRTSSGPSLLDRVDPLVGVAGVGVDNRFGFPHASVSRRYLQRGAPLYWTGRHGPLRACTDGWSLRVERSPKEGRWELLREWDPEAIDAWWRRAGAATPEPPRCAAAKSGWRKPPRSRKRRRASPPEPARRARASAPPERESARLDPTPAPEPPPPVLLDDREWERRRRRRGRFR